MPSLSERLKVTHQFVLTVDVQQAAAVCAAVEAFQAAERLYQQAVECGAEIEVTFPLHQAVWSAKARLLEVDLGRAMRPQVH